MQRRDEIPHGLRRVGFRVAAPDNALFRMEIDQYDRSVGDGRDASNHGPLEFHNNRSRFEASDRKRLKWHNPRPLFADG